MSYYITINPKYYRCSPKISICHSRTRFTCSCSLDLVLNATQKVSFTLVRVERVTSSHRSAQHYNRKLDHTNPQWEDKRHNSSCQICNGLIIKSSVFHNTNPNFKSSQTSYRVGTRWEVSQMTSLCNYRQVAEYKTDGTCNHRAMTEREKHRMLLGKRRRSGCWARFCVVCI